MIDSDVAELVSWFLSSFGLGLAFSLILRVFRRAVGYIR